MKSNISSAANNCLTVDNDLIQCKLDRENIKQILVFHPKRLNKIKLKDVIAILTLSLLLFIAEDINILHSHRI